MHFRTILGPFKVTQHCKVELKNRKDNKVVPKIGVFRENNTLPIQLLKMWINLSWERTIKSLKLGTNIPISPKVRTKFWKTLNKQRVLITGSTKVLPAFPVVCLYVTAVHFSSSRSSGPIKSLCISSAHGL
jgi:hypothetical protein